MRLAAASVALGLVVVTIQPAQAQTFNTLASFNYTNGSEPYYAGLVQATDGNLYRTTYSGGANNYGTVFQISLSGTLTTLHSFAGSDDGTGPIGPLVQGTDGNFYGTTYGVAGHDYGTVFKITLSGTLTTLYGFLPGDDGHPYAGLVQANDGNFYGTTNGAGSAHGTVFQITPSGTFTTLYFFCSQMNCTDGSYPYDGLVRPPTVNRVLPLTITLEARRTRSLSCNYLQIERATAIKHTIRHVSGLPYLPLLPEP